MNVVVNRRNEKIIRCSSLSFFTHLNTDVIVVLTGFDTLENGRLF